MFARQRSMLVALFTLVVAGNSPAQAQTPDSPAPASPADIEFFEKKIRPILVERCYACHSAQAKKVQGGLRLDSRAAVLQGGDDGPAVVPGDLPKSHLIQAIRYGTDYYQMPPQGKLPTEVVADFERWVSLGAPDPRIADSATRSTAGISDTSLHWAFQPPRRAPLPDVQSTAWPRTDIDRHVLARLESRGLSPSEDADRRTLLRRVSYDLVGLPPSFAESEAFAADQSPEAFDKVVDRLLASPQFGERWARHWLDVARYADTKGYVFQEDRNYPEAFTYRDWVIKAFREDLPYDRFVIAQIAADQGSSPQDPASLAAMGYLTLGRRFINNIHDIIDDRIDVVARGLLGLTVTCARCHDHKYDPIPSADYYALYGVFASSQEPKNAPSPLRLVDAPQPHNARVLKRGNPGNPGEEVPRQFLLLLAGEKRQPFQQGSGRLELAQAIASHDNPLTARVFVNRVWGHLFGQGLVRTPSDFGTRSDPPSHPELLDYLALRLGDEGWSVKKLIRQIVLSRVYQQRSDDRPPCRERDPENQLLWKMNRRRLDFESLRDTLLAVSGQLDTTVGGPSVQLTTQPFSKRRTLYGFIDRQNLPGLFRTFDFANPDTHAPQRFHTTVPQQALFLMNGPFVREQAEALLRRPEVAGASEPARRIGQLYRMAYGREPRSEELALGQEFLAADVAVPEDAGQTGTASPGLGVWERYAQVLLLANELVFVD